MVEVVQCAPVHVDSASSFKKCLVSTRLETRAGDGFARRIHCLAPRSRAAFDSLSPAIRAIFKRASIAGDNSLFVVLGLRPGHDGSSLTNVNRAYKKLAFMVHPDKYATRGEGMHEFAKQTFQKLALANTSRHLLRRFRRLDRHAQDIALQCIDPIINPANFTLDRRFIRSVSMRMGMRPSVWISSCRSI
jgi:hypothetical protein